MKLKSQLEAILFLSDKPVKAAAMARIVSQDVQLVRQALLDLIHDYEERDGGLEIADDDGYIIQVRDAYASIVDEFAPMEMPVSLIRTLSAIAIKQPVAQSEIIKIRGAGAYDHIKELMVRELILKKEEGGRSPLLSTTKKFQEYFRLTQDAKVLRTQLGSDERKAKLAAAAAAGGGDDVLAPEDDLDIAAQLTPLRVAAPEAVPGAAIIAETAIDLMVSGIVTDALGDGPETTDAAPESDEVTFEIDHVESRAELEKVFATSPDASLVYRPTVQKKKGGTLSTNDNATGRDAETSGPRDDQS